MIIDNQKQFSRFHMLIDILVISFSYVLAWAIRFVGPFANTAVRAKSFRDFMLLLLLIIPGYLLLYQAFSLYTPLRMQGRRLVLSNVIQANTLGLLIIIAILYVIEEHDYSRLTFFIFYVINVILECGFRMTVFYILRNLRKKGYNQKQVLLVGYSRAAGEYIERIKENPQWGYVVRGILDDNVPAGTEYRGVKVLGRIANLMVILPNSNLDEIAITLGLNEYYRLEEIVGLCEKSGVHTKFIPDYNNIIPTKPYTEDIQGLPVINIRYVPLSNTFNAMVKRAMDVVGALIALVLASPVMLVVSVLIKLTSRGPLIYKQERVTGIGRFMRRTSIDELPQLINILKGDMSLVGPRPERPFFVEKFREEIPRYMVKHQVRPGLTGWAQVNGYRGDTSIRKRIEYDLYYIENWTVGLDIKIILMTFFKGFINKNAY